MTSATPTQDSFPGCAIQLLLIIAIAALIAAAMNTPRPIAPMYGESIGRWARGTFHPLLVTVLKGNPKGAVTGGGANRTRARFLATLLSQLRMIECEEVLLDLNDRCG